MCSLIPSDAYDPQGLMRRYEPNKQTIIGSLNLTYDLVSRNCIESGAYFLYSFRLEFQIWFVNASWDVGVSHTIFCSLCPSP